jgi:hypothetical protein
MSDLSRREFIGRTAAAAAAMAMSPVARAFATRHKLGFDNFAVRAFAWKAPQLVDYAATLGCSSILVSDLGATARGREGPADPSWHVERLSHLQGVQGEPRYCR